MRRHRDAGRLMSLACFAGIVLLAAIAKLLQ